MSDPLARRHDVRAAAPRARRRRSSVTPGRTTSISRSAARPRRATSATALARQLVTVADPRERHREDRAHARPHGLRRVRVGAARAERHARRAEGLRRARRTVPTLPGSATPCRYTHSGPTGHAPALLVDPDRARARAERRDLGQQRPARHRRSPRRRARSRPRGSPQRRPARAPRRPRSGPRPRPGSAAALALAPAAQRAAPSGVGSVVS